MGMGGPAPYPTPDMRGPAGIPRPPMGGPSPMPMGGAGATTGGPGPLPMGMGMGGVPMGGGGSFFTDTPVLMVYKLPSKDRIASALAARAPPSSSSGSSATPPSALTHDMVFNLFNLFGEVVRVRLLSTGKTPGDESAMVEMATPEMAARAGDLLQRVVVFGRGLNIQPSKHTTLIAPSVASAVAQAGADQARAASILLGHGIKDYTDFQRSRSRRGAHAASEKPPAPPCSTLYFTNTPPGFDEEGLRATMRCSWAPQPTHIRFLPVHADRDSASSRRSGFMDFPSVEEAVEAIMLANNAQVDAAGHVHMRLTFAMRPMNKPHTSGLSSAPMTGGAASGMRAGSGPALRSPAATPATKPASAGASGAAAGATGGPSNGAASASAGGAEEGVDVDGAAFHVVHDAGAAAAAAAGAGAGQEEVEEVHVAGDREGPAGGDEAVAFGEEAARRREDN